MVDGPRDLSVDLGLDLVERSPGLLPPVAPPVLYSCCRAADGLYTRFEKKPGPSAPCGGVGVALPPALVSLGVCPLGPPPGPALRVALSVVVLTLLTDGRVDVAVLIVLGEGRCPVPVTLQLSCAGSANMRRQDSYSINDTLIRIIRCQLENKENIGLNRS